MKLYLSSVSILLFVSIVLCQKKDLYPRAETLYASSLFRLNQVLEGVSELDSIGNVSSVSICLLNCMKRKPDCKAFNWGNGECVLLADSVCFNETLLLTSKAGFAYYDIMESPDYEKKHLKDGYCRLFGKCSGKCYPRTPHYSDTSMTRDKAKEFCDTLGRTLPMPTNLEEQRFFENFAKKRLSEQPDIRTMKDMKFWIGITKGGLLGDKWMYDDETPMEKFSAWAAGEPDGNREGKDAEDCGAFGEKAEFKWTDVNCRLKLKFFCA